MNRVRLPVGRAQRGISLIELLVGLTIGLMVALAALVSVQHVRASGQSADAAIVLQQDAATAWRVLGTHLRQAGAWRLVPTLSNQVQFNPGYGGTADKNTRLSLAGSNGAGNTSDTLTVALDAEQGVTSTCQGNPAGNSLTMETEFRVQNNELTCLSTLTDPDNGNSISNSNGTVVAGVQSFQVRYLERQNNGSLQRVDVPSDWARVEAVDVCLHLAGGRAEVASDIVDCQGTAVPLPAGPVHRVFNRVFQLRNNTP